MCLWPFLGTLSIPTEEVKKGSIFHFVKDFTQGLLSLAVKYREHPF